MEESISLQEIFAIIKKRIVLIITSAFIFLGISAVVTFVFITPKFSSSAQLIVKLPLGDSTQNVNDVNFNLQMINTYKDIIKSNIVADETHDILTKKGKYNGTAEGIKKMIEVNQETNSQMFTITTTSDNAYEAQAVTGTVAKVFQKQAKKVIDIDKITIIADADLNLKPVSPNNKLNLLLGTMLGVFIGVGLTFLMELLDKTVKDDRFIKETLELPILGTVSEMSPQELSAKIVKESKGSTQQRSVTMSDEGESAISRKERKRI